MRPSEMKAPKDNLTVLLKRTFDQKGLQGEVYKYWRVIGPKNHKNYQSDLSVEGLKTWGIIQ